jgi:hypothetical protein
MKKEPFGAPSGRKMPQKRFLKAFDVIGLFFAYKEKEPLS